MGNPLKTSVYIDGFNLYYGALKQTPYKWLDIGKLCQVMLPAHVIHTIKFFTANVSARPHDPVTRSSTNLFSRTQNYSECNHNLWAFFYTFSAYGTNRSCASEKSMGG